MIKANFKTYNTYVTDSLYQWDINQVLTVSGLNLAVAPEVHFSNANMDKAIVRQASLKDLVVSVDIPNSLLQEALTIKAHIGIYENNTFKVVEIVEIPVIAKTRPADYTLQDSDEEIYSFEALKNDIANMVKLSDYNSNNDKISARIDNLIAGGTVLSGRYDLTLTPNTGNPVGYVLTNDSNAVIVIENYTELNSAKRYVIATIPEKLRALGVHKFTPMDNITITLNDDKLIVDNLGVAVSSTTLYLPYPLKNASESSELVDIRVGANNVTYPSAGEAVRLQFENIKNEVQALKTVTSFNLVIGSVTSGIDEPTTIRARIDGMIKACRAVVSFVANSTYYYGYTIFNDDKEYDGVDHGWNAMTDTPLYVDSGYFKMNFKRFDNAEITIEDLQMLKSYVTITQFNALGDIEKLYSFENKGTPIISLFDLEIGSLNAGLPVDMANRARFTEKIKITEKTVVTFSTPGLYLYGCAFYDENGNYNGIDTGWRYPSNYPTIEFSKPGYIRMNFQRTDNANITSEDLTAIKDYLVIETYKNVRDLVNDIDNVSNELQSKIDTVENKNNAINSINIEYGRKNGASYVLARIPKNCNNGNTLRPKVRLTSGDGALNGTKISALDYAQRNNTIFTINAGLFDMTAMIPLGQTIIDGVALTNTPMTDDNGSAISDVECYPLCIDANGDLSAPYARSVNTADMIADGIIHAVTGWGKIIDNFKPCSDTVENEIVHAGTYIRQCIGQYQNGDYVICTVDMSRNTVENEAGISYADLAELLVSKGVKFAYSLDGGGSAETVIEKRQLNPIYEGIIGRAVPTVIVFDLD